MSKESRISLKHKYEHERFKMIFEYSCQTFPVVKSLRQRERVGRGSVKSAIRAILYVSPCTVMSLECILARWFGGSPPLSYAQVAAIMRQLRREGEVLLLGDPRSESLIYIRADARYSKFILPFTEADF